MTMLKGYPLINKLDRKDILKQDSANDTGSPSNDVSNSKTTRWPNISRDKKRIAKTNRYKGDPEPRRFDHGQERRCDTADLARRAHSLFSTRLPVKAKLNEPEYRENLTGPFK